VTINDTVTVTIDVTVAVGVGVSESYIEGRGVHDDERRPFLVEHDDVRGAPVTQRGVLSSCGVKVQIDREIIIFIDVLCKVAD
jgi:hypothetical protein